MIYEEGILNAKKEILSKVMLDSLKNILKLFDDEDKKIYLIESNDLEKSDYNNQDKEKVTLSNDLEKAESQNPEKEKVTFYIPREAIAKFNEVYIKYLMRNEKINKSQIISKAIDLLWKEEKTYDI